MLKSNLLKKYASISHGFTTKKDTNLSFLEKTYTAEQTHTASIQVIQKKSPKIIASVDGLITSRINTKLSIKTADCVPILLFEQATNQIGAIHAGWKGTYNEICSNALKELIKRGANPQNIKVILGPSIKTCCYSVPEKRARMFKKKWSNAVIKREKDWFLSLQTANISQSTKLGVQYKNIESLDYCTSCRKDLFYSFRRDKTNIHTMYSFISLNE